MPDLKSETLVARLYQHARERPAAPALADPTQMLSWKELDETTNRVANALLARGITRGARVALIADTNVRAALLLLGILKCGACAVPVPTLFGADAVARILEDCQARLLFAAASCRKLLGPAIAGRALERVAIDFEDSGWSPLEDWLTAGSTAPAAASIVPDDEFNIIYSSGTTGRPKGIVHDHALRASSALRLGPIAFPPGVRTLTTTALYSNWTMGALIYTLWAGGCLRMLGKFTVPDLLRTAQSYQPGNVYLVPVQIGRVLELLRDTTDVPVPAPALKWTAGSYLSPEWKRELLERWPGGLIELYGTTEGAPATLLMGHERPDKLHTVGRATPPEDVKVIDVEGRECPVGTRGEIVGRVRTVMRGYNRDPAATDTLRWYDNDGNEYFRSGDIGVLDNEGFLQVTDRKKDMIISGGFNIYASDLEEVLRGHPLVAEVAVFGVPSARWGETPAAAVVLREAAAAEGADLTAWANARLGRLQRLAAVVIVEKLPRGSLEKVLKRDLRERFAHLGDRPARESGSAVL